MELLEEHYNDFQVMLRLPNSTYMNPSTRSAPCGVNNTPGAGSFED